MSLLGNYEIIKEIAEGGFSRIFQGRHTILNEYACLKQNKEATKDDVALLELEAKLLWNLSEHHSIPSTKDFFRLGKHNCVMVMDYIEGKTIDQTIPDGSQMHPEEACWITERLLGALYYVHYNGVIHSDIKPQNVIIEPKKHDIKLIDFGLATFKPTSGSRPVGYTAQYAAPEVLDMKPPIPESDLYGAGIIMLYALGGDIPTKSFPKNTPKPIVEFCNPLLRYDPKDRPNWDKINLIEELSDVRYEVFGRRHCSE
jgi:eukaryotic-like serine/threonine-protein kinase